METFPALLDLCEGNPPVTITLFVQAQIKENIKIPRH